MGFSGGLLLVWDSSKVKFTPTGKDLHSLHKVVQVISSSYNFMFSSIYASTKFKRRKIPWNNLKSLSQIIDLPWLVICDFNKVCNQLEKLGG